MFTAFLGQEIYRFSKGWIPFLLCMELWENLKDKNQDNPVLICCVSFALQDALKQSYLGSISYCKHLLVMC